MDVSRPGAVPELDVQGQIAFIRLRRPAQANRLERIDLEALRVHLAWLRENLADVRAVILVAEGRHFCAGFDLSDIESAVHGDASALFARMVDELEALPQVTICAIQGGVFGGATDLALACDFRLGVADTRMFMPAARFGLHYYSTGLGRYVSRLGLNAAKRVVLLAEEFDAQELLKIGFLSEVVQPDALAQRAAALASHAAEKAPLAVASMKAALNAIAAGAADALTIEQGYRLCMASADMQEGITALRDRRAPRFQAK